MPKTTKTKVVKPKTKVVKPKTKVVKPKQRLQLNQKLLLKL